jgi:hypothetical protein
MQSTTNKKPTEFVPTPLAIRAAQSIAVLAPFISNMQSVAIADGFRGREKNYFMQKVVDLADLIDGMPTTLEQDGNGDQTMVFLHYYYGAGSWFITEKDINGGVDRAFGYSFLQGDERHTGFGYISIRELTCCDVQLDFDFMPRTLAEIKAELKKRAA